jgi:hypothetical protein
MEYILNSMMNVVVPPASMVMMAFAWPTLSFLRAAEWAVKSFFREDMENKVVLITGASSAIGEVTYCSIPINVLLSSFSCLLEENFCCLLIKLTIGSD